MPTKRRRARPRPEPDFFDFLRWIAGGGKGDGPFTKYEVGMKPAAGPPLVMLPDAMLRKLTALCHPDKHAGAFKDTALEVSIWLNTIRDARRKRGA